jgi:hypothetical protein
MTSKQSTNYSPESVVREESQNSKNEETMDLQTLLKRLALDSQELAESEERVLQMIASTEDRMAKMLETQSNQQRDFSQMMKNHVALTQSQSKLGDVVLGLSAEIAKMAAQQEATRRRSDTAARQVHLQTVASLFDAKTNSPISQDSNAEAHFLADSALYGFDRPVPKRLTNSVEKRDYGQQKTRRESQPHAHVTLRGSLSSGNRLLAG